MNPQSTTQLLLPRLSMHHNMIKSSPRAFLLFCTNRKNTSSILCCYCTKYVFNKTCENRLLYQIHFQQSLWKSVRIRLL